MEKRMTAEKIVAAGKVSIRVRRAGVLQVLEFVVQKGVSPEGEYPYLSLDKFIDLSELLRVSEEYNLPVFGKNGRVFPPGKSAKDFAHLLKKK